MAHSSGKAANGSRWFIAGCIVQLLTAAAHTVTHLRPEPEPPEETAATLRRLMHEYKLPEINRTAQELFSGFGLWFAMSLACAAIAGLVVRSVRKDDTGLLRALAAMNLLFLTVGLAISLRYFFLIPTTFLGAAWVCFAAAFVRAKGSAARV